MYIDSNSIKNIIYDYNDLYNNKYQTIYFKNMTTNTLEKIVNNKNLNILSYIIDDKKIYAKDIENLENEIKKEMSIEEQSIINIHGIKVDGISLLCTPNDIINLKKEIDIF